MSITEINLVLNEDEIKPHTYKVKVQKVSDNIFTVHNVFTKSIKFKYLDKIEVRKENEFYIFKNVIEKSNFKVCRLELNPGYLIFPEIKNFLEKVNSLGGNWELPKKFAIIIAWPIIHHEKLKRELEVIINEIKIQKNFKNKEELIELFNSFFQNKMKLSKLKQNNLLVTFLKDPKSNMENDLWLAREIFFLYNINSIVLNLETIQSFDSSLVAFFLNWRVYHLKNYPTGYLKLKLGKNPKTFNMFNKLGLTTYFDFI